MKRLSIILSLMMVLCFTISCQKGEEVAGEPEQINTGSFALNNGIRIYYEIEGSGPSIVLQHGWSNSLEYWRDFGYTEALKQDYQLILIDARGHGKSDIPNDPDAYDTSIMAEDIITVLNHSEIDKAHFLGYSMGGWIGFDLAELYPERFYSFIIGGAHPYPLDLSFARELVKGEMSAFLDLWDNVSAPFKPDTRRQLSEQDPTPLRAIASKDRPDMSHVLSSLTMPCLVYVGEDDAYFEGAKECANHLPNGTFVSFPGLDHLEVYIRSDLVLPYIMNFLAENSQR